MTIRLHIFGREHQLVSCRCHNITQNTEAENNSYVNQTNQLEINLSPDVCQKIQTLCSDYRITPAVISLARASCYNVGAMLTMCYSARQYQGEIYQLMV